MARRDPLDTVNPPDGALLVAVGSYAAAVDPGIHLFSFDPADVELRRVGEFRGIHNPSFVALGAGGRTLFAVSETGEGSDGAGGTVHSLRLEPAGDRLQLTATGSVPTGGDHPCHIGISESGRWLAVSNYSSGSVAVVPVMDDGSLRPDTHLARHSGRGARDDRQTGPHAHSATFSPGGRFLLVADLGIDRVIVYAVGDDGSITEQGRVATAPGAGPRHLAFHPKGDRVFLVNELDNTLVAHGFDRDTGAMEPLGVVSVVTPGVTENTAADIRLSPTGRFAYVSNRGDDSIAVVALDDPERLEVTAIRSCGGSWPRGLALAPGGDHLLVANRHSDDVVVLPVTAGGADVAPAVAEAAVQQPSGLAVGYSP